MKDTGTPEAPGNSQNIRVNGIAGEKETNEIALRPARVKRETMESPLWEIDFDIV